MTKHEFDHWLRYRLSDLPAHELERISAFYQDAIADRMEDGMTEDEAIYALGEPEALLEDIRASLPYPETAYEEAPPPRTSRRRNVLVALVIVVLVIGLLGSALPLLIFNIATSGVRNEVIYEAPIDIPMVEEAVTIYEDDAFEPYSIEKIAVKADAASIVVEPSPDGMIHVIADPFYYEVSQEEVTLVIVTSSDFTGSDNSIRLQLPMDYSFYHLTIAAEVGDVELYEICPQSLQVTLETGNIWLNWVSAMEGIELKTEIGGIFGTLQGSAQDYITDASVEMGSNNLGDTASGHINLWAEVEMGDIDIQFGE